MHIAQQLKQTSSSQSKLIMFLNTNTKSRFYLEMNTIKKKKSIRNDIYVHDYDVYGTSKIVQSITKF
jgi:hypothetical protein